MTPITTLTRDLQVGIYDAEIIARIYTNKIIVVEPYVRWVGNSGGYAERKVAIRDTKTIANIRADLADDCDDDAWDRIIDAIAAY